MRLIDSDALERDGWKLHRTIRVDKNTMEYQVKKPTDFPAIEPERENGEWVVLPDGRLSCSNCCSVPTNRIIINGNLVYDMTPIREKMKFCPNCGADLRGDTNVNE